MIKTLTGQQSLAILLSRYRRGFSTPREPWHSKIVCRMTGMCNCRVRKGYRSGSQPVRRCNKYGGAHVKISAVASTIPPHERRREYGQAGGVLPRDIPREVMDKMRAAAAIHKRPLKAYLLELFEAHIRELEREGLILSHEGKHRKH